MHICEVSMADYRVHISQAKHNEEVASKLVNEVPYHDWGITAAFYSAIHYFESWLYSRPEKHTETSIPVGSDGKFQHTPHAWREKLVCKNLSKNAFKSFRRLRDASETSRYLSFYRTGQGGMPQWLDKPASEYFKPEDAKELVENDLILLREELQFSNNKKQEPS